MIKTEMAAGSNGGRKPNNYAAEYIHFVTPAPPGLDLLSQAPWCPRTWPTALLNVSVGYSSLLRLKSTLNYFLDENHLFQITNKIFDHLLSMHNTLPFQYLSLDGGWLCNSNHILSQSHFFRAAPRGRGVNGR